MSSQSRTPEKKKRFVVRVLEWAQKNLRDFPWRETDRPYEIFIAETLLKRTTSTAAERVFDDFLNEFPDIASLANADVENLEEILKPIGLYRQRSEGLKEAAEHVMENFNGRLPSSYEDLLEVPHIGPYSAGAIDSFAFGDPVPIVDSNVKRVVGRCFRGEWGDADPKDREIRSFLEDIVPQKRHRAFNLGLIDLGFLVCSYDEKHCNRCPLSEICDVSGGDK